MWETMLKQGKRGEGRDEEVCLLEGENRCSEEEGGGDLEVCLLEEENRG